MTNIEAIFMANCRLVGSLPSWLGNLKELRQLDLQHNTCTGQMPNEIGLLNNLLYLNVKDNIGLNGELPLEAIARLTKLNRLSLVNCSFSNSQEAVDILQVRLPRCRLWI